MIAPGPTSLAPCLAITLCGAPGDVEGFAVDGNAFIVAEFADHVLRLLGERWHAEPGTDGARQ